MPHKPEISACKHCGLSTGLDQCPKCDWIDSKNKYYEEMTPEEELAFLHQ